MPAASAGRNVPTITMLRWMSLAAGVNCWFCTPAPMATASLEGSIGMDYSSLSGQCQVFGAGTDENAALMYHAVEGGRFLSSPLDSVPFFTHTLESEGL